MPRAAIERPAIYSTNPQISGFLVDATLEVANLNSANYPGQTGSLSEPFSDSLQFVSVQTPVALLDGVAHWTQPSGTPAGVARTPWQMSP